MPIFTLTRLHAKVAVVAVTAVISYVHVTLRAQHAHAFVGFSTTHSWSWSWAWFDLRCALNASRAHRRTTGSMAIINYIED